MVLKMQFKRGVHIGPKTVDHSLFNIHYSLFITKYLIFIFILAGYLFQNCGKAEAKKDKGNEDDEPRLQ